MKKKTKPQKKKKKKGPSNLTDTENKNPKKTCACCEGNLDLVFATHVGHIITHKL